MYHVPDLHSDHRYNVMLIVQGHKKVWVNRGGGGGSDGGGGGEGRGKGGEKEKRRSARKREEGDSRGKREVKGREDDCIFVTMSGANGN